MSFISAHTPTRLITRTVPDISTAFSATFPSQLFAPIHAGRRGEGGLRTKRYFKAAKLLNEDSEGTRKSPLITVVSAVFNGAQTLEKSILSVLGQTYDNVEYIIIDGGSTDSTLEIIRKYEHAIDYWISEPDAGIYDAWNKGVRLAAGDWIAFLGGDDSYTSSALQSYADFIVTMRDREYEYISSNVNLVSAIGLERTVGSKWNWKTFRRYMNVAHVGSLHHRNLFKKYGLYDTSYKMCGDYEFLLRPGPELRAAYLGTVTVEMRIGGTSDNGLQAMGEAKRAKICTGKRRKLLCSIEEWIAVAKWRIRKRLWY